MSTRTITITNVEGWRVGDKYVATWPDGTTLTGTLMEGEMDLRKGRLMLSGTRVTVRNTDLKTVSRPFELKVTREVDDPVEPMEIDTIVRLNFDTSPVEHHAIRTGSRPAPWFCLDCCARFAWDSLLHLHNHYGLRKLETLKIYRPVLVEENPQPIVSRDPQLPRTPSRTVAIIGEQLNDGTACEHCGASYARCIQQVLGQASSAHAGLSCCTGCQMTDTHQVHHHGTVTVP